MEEQKLEYLGVETMGDKTYHKLRGWSGVIADSARYRATEPVVWFFDTETLLLRKVRFQGDITFLYQSLDTPLPESLFALPDSKELTVSEFERLEKGYDKRCLYISDGSNGRVSFRWGTTGPKGSALTGY